MEESEVVNEMYVLIRNVVAVSWVGSEEFEDVVACSDSKEELELVLEEMMDTMSNSSSDVLIDYRVEAVPFYSYSNGQGSVYEF